MDANPVTSSQINIPAGYQLDQPGLPEGYSLDPQTSVLGAAGRGALDAIPFGTKGAAAVESGLGSGTYDQYLKELDSLLAADKEQHPIAHYGGEAAGTIAPFAIPGVGEALGAESLAGRAGVGAGLGALQAASNNRNSATLPTDIALGAGSGALLNPAIGALGDMASTALGRAAQGAEDYANDQAVQSGGFRAGMLGKLSEEQNQDLGKFMNANDLVQGDLPTRLQKAQVLKQALGNKIGEMGDAAATLDNPQDYIDPLKEASLKYSSSANAEAKNLGGTYIQGAQDIENQLPKGASYQDIQDLKDMYSGLAFAPDHSVKNEAAADVYGALKQMQQDIVNNSPDEFKQVMKNYSNAADITTGLQKQLGISRAGNPNGGGGISKVIRGLPGMQNPAVSISAGLGLMGTGKTFSGLMVAGQGLNNPAFKAAAAQTVAKGATAAAPAINSAVAPATNSLENILTQPAMAPYKPVFQQASSGLTDPADIQKSQTVTDFLMQSRDPNYAAARQKASEETANAF